MNSFNCLECCASAPCKPSEVSTRKFCSTKCKATHERKTKSGRNSCHYRPEKERFWEKVSKSDNCWTWIGHLDATGYGRFNAKQSDRAHRYSYILHFGSIPHGLLVCHKCDNPSCVNPDHLFVGTDKDNRDDCIAKGRHNAPTGDRNFRHRHPESLRGENAPNAKLTAHQVRQIRSLYKPHVVMRKDLALKFNISRAQIDRIIEGSAWCHLPVAEVFSVLDGEVRGQDSAQGNGRVTGREPSAAI